MKIKISVQVLHSSKQASYPPKGCNKYSQLNGKYFGEPTVELITILCWERANVESEGSLGNSIEDQQLGSLCSFIVLDKIQLLRMIFDKLISKTYISVQNYGLVKLSTAPCYST